MKRTAPTSYTFQTGSDKIGEFERGMCLPGIEFPVMSVLQVCVFGIGSYVSLE